MAPGASDYLYFLWTQWFVRPAYPSTSWEGKTVVVTGANVGLGREAVRHFVRLGVEKVIMGVRSMEKGEEARKDIERTEKRKGVMEVWQVDLESYESVRQFVKRVEGLDRIDAVVENAGKATQKFHLAEDQESTVTVNVISTFLMALLLLPKLRAVGKKYNIQPRLAIVSSEVHAWSEFKERDEPGQLFEEVLADPKKSNMDDRYPLSKLLEVLFIQELVKQRAPSGYPVIINFLNPGFCHSGLARDLGLGIAVLKFFMARRTDIGARTLVHAASAGPESHGKYLSDCTVSTPGGLAASKRSEELRVRVWKDLSGVLEKIEPGVLEKI
ncbi:short-chain dehydrogenase/reductase-like protein [Patellaria atrata CBS 101060]|uniref:Short-chain dehydrogenase/reductase-like protein n=1 Tax=Patellaria atrata CBS 101060 TaxID=1346257 RepID=A0A9P4VL40_9PEZI|nr:short-chain dehydrogenase/reductase-like protein [Patellaria atrata CBS 101060]